MMKNKSAVLDYRKLSFLNALSKEVAGISGNLADETIGRKLKNIRFLLQTDSLFLSNDKVYLEVKNHANKLLKELDPKKYISELYKISIILNLEAELRKSILRCNPEELEAAISVYDNEVINLICRLFSLKPQPFIDALNATEISKNQDRNLMIIFRIAPNQNEIHRYFKRIKFSIQSFDILMDELKRNPCRTTYIEQLSFFNDFLVYVGSLESQQATIVKVLLHFFTEISNPNIDNFLNEALIKSIQQLSLKNSRNLFLMIRRLPSKSIGTDFCKKVLETVEYEKSIVKKMILYRLISENLCLDERLKLHYQEFQSANNTTVNFNELTSLASVLNLPMTSMSLIKCEIEDEDVRRWLPSESFDSLLELFNYTNTASFLQTHKPMICKPLVSVIITVFNPDINLLRESIKSILLQRDVDLEVIVVDDASNDAMKKQLRALINSLTDEYEILIKFIERDVNQGQYACRNVALEHATGEYICIQDDDDISHPLRLAKQINALNKNEGTLLCYAKHIRINENLVPSIDDRDSLSILGDGPATLLFKKEIYEDIGGFRILRSRGDIEFRERAIKYYGSDSVVILPYPLYLVRSSLASVSSIYEYLYNDKLSFYRDLIKNNMNYRCINSESQALSYE